MKCPLCSCPRAIEILTSLSCLNAECENWEHDAADKAEYDAEAQLINGDSYDEIKEFLYGKDTDLIL